MVTEKPSFSERIVAVTGAGFDVGRSLSVALAERGATVILVDKHPRALNAIYDDIKALNAPEPIIAELDLAKPEEAPAQFLAKQIFDQFGRLDALIHAAEWAFPLAPLALYEAESMQNAWQRLYYAPWLLTKSLLPVLSHANKAKVLFSLPEYERRMNNYWGAYGAAFSALENTVDIWNKELNNKGLYFYTLPITNIATQMRRKHFPAENPEGLTPPDDQSVIEAFLSKLET